MCTATAGREQVPCTALSAVSPLSTGSYSENRRARGRRLASAPVDEVVGDVEFAGQPHLVDLVVLHHALHVTSCFGERDSLDPVDDRVEALAARIAVFAIHSRARRGPAL